MRTLAPHLEPGTGYHFPDHPSVQYSGKLAAAECAELLPRLQTACNELVAADAATSVAIFQAGDAAAAAAAGATDKDTEGYAEGSTVRIVAVGDADNRCPCGGTHVESAADLRGLRILRIKSKKGITKVTYDMELGSA
jgi:Ser-tRNA(Ala) deacylase AlaX